MSDEHDFEVGPDGTLRAVYNDDVPALAADMGATVASVERLTHVEWETTPEGLSGWTVRSARDPDLALRLSGDDCAPLRRGTVFLFRERSSALAAERLYAWDLR